MIESMTGYGGAQHVAEGLCYAVEVRSLNNRYLKLSIKLPERLQFLDYAVERIIRKRLVRGSVSFQLRLRGEGGAGIQPINTDVLQHYVDKLSSVRLSQGVEGVLSLDLGAIAMLPGVCEAGDVDDEDRKRQEEAVVDVTNRALDALAGMRRTEGARIFEDLTEYCSGIRSRVVGIKDRAPTVLDEYHERLKARVATLMQSGGFELAADGLMREVAIYAERCDISEEIARLDSHLDQFAELCQRGEPVGRTLDFLTQELLREANTIASKSNDAAIAHEVVDIKGLIDRLREQVQNVE